MIVVRRVRGSPAGSSVDAAQCCKFDDFNTIAASDVYVKTGRVFFEARIDVAVGCVQLGWISDGFARSDKPSDGDGVGDDLHSWAGDGLRQQRWHGGELDGFDAAWATGDVVGVAVDLDAGRLHFAVNGAWAGAFDGIAVPASGLAPALSGSGGFAATLNLGNATMAFGPPDESYLTVQSAMSNV